MIRFAIVLSWAVFENASSSAVSRWGEAAQLVEVMPREHMLNVPQMIVSTTRSQSCMRNVLFVTVGELAIFTFSISEAGGSHWLTRNHNTSSIPKL
jgi:hypothetical protein